jgi:hypothetical protein
MKVEEMVSDFVHTVVHLVVLSARTVLRPQFQLGQDAYARRETRPENWTNERTR